jgi:hypothetical protein
MADPTANHDLNRPDSGARNWHVPLNENFGHIDSRIEIRDTSANRSEYAPKDGAKFLATDTGAIYTGDGSEWSETGSISGSPGGVMAAPGEVQSVINQYSTGHEWGPQPMQTITLISGVEYETTDTWRLKPGTRLDCNGALIRPRGDFDVLELGKDTIVHEPRVNVADIDNFSSACIVMTADSGKINTANPSSVQDCHLFNDRQNGVGIQFKGDSNPVSIQRASGIVHNFDRGVEFRAEGNGSGSNDGWCNGNRFDGSISGSRIPIYLNSVNGSPVSGNTVSGQIQCSENTEWVIRQEDAPDDTNIRGNTYYIQIWDESNISNGYEAASNRTPPLAPFWYIGTGQQEYNSLRSQSGSHSNEFILNRSTVGRSRNGIFTGTGESSARGATEFSHESTYMSNDAPFHPES